VSLNARLLLLGRDDTWMQRLSESLDRLGLRTLSAPAPEAAFAALEDLAIEAVLVDDDTQTQAPDLVRRLRAAAAPRRIPVILARQDDLYDIPDGWDMVFTRDAHPQQIALTIEHMTRACVAEEEYDTRCQTFNISSQEVEALMEDQAPLALLSIGKPDPEYLALTHALKNRGVEITAALSSYSAFDYLHDKTFDAVLLWSGDQASEALSIASGMRRNTRLYHTPVLLRVTETAEFDLGEAYLRGVNDIANVKAGTEEICDRLLRLARINRRQTTIRKTLETMRHSPKMDKGTGLFGRDLFAAHLGRLSKAASERNRPLSICVLKIADTPEIVRARQRKLIDRAVPQIGSMIARLVRAEDSGSRLSNEVFALALPATSLDAARNVGERIAAVIGCTAFDSGQGKPPYVVEFEVGAAQILEDEPVTAALNRAADEINNRNREAV
jgi:two-component system cell cycle response regulator PopA